MTKPADSIVPDPADPQAFNRYSYVLGNPLRYTDSTGNFVDQEEFARVQGNLSRFGCGYNATFQIICATPSGGSRVHTYTPRPLQPNTLAGSLRAVRAYLDRGCAFPGGSLDCTSYRRALSAVRTYLNAGCNFSGARPVCPTPPAPPQPASESCSWNPFSGGGSCYAGGLRTAGEATLDGLEVTGDALSATGEATNTFVADNWSCIVASATFAEGAIIMYAGVQTGQPLVLIWGGTLTYAAWRSVESECYGR